MSTPPDFDEANLRDFVAKIEAALQPGFSEVLTHETRRIHRVLLALSFLILLIAWDALQFSGSLEVIGLRFTGPTAKKVVLEIGCVVSLYLELLAAIRSFAEWHVWQIRTLTTAVDADSINSAFQVVVSQAREDALKRGFVGLRDDASPEVIAQQPELLRAALTASESFAFLARTTVASCVALRPTRSHAVHVSRWRFSFH